MSSSTSSSDAPWRGFVRTGLVAAGAILSAFLLLAVLLDPYDTGRSPLALKEGVRPQGPRTAAASRGRDPDFTGAIFGNSHIQLVSPENLLARTGIPFVSLIAPATGPRETFTLLDWWLRHRIEPARAIVIGIDQRWCVADPALPSEKPFPYWLFARNGIEYLGGLIRFDVVEELQRRLVYLTRPKAERARPDGYWDYEDGYIVQGFDTDAARRARLAAPAELSGTNTDGPFPAVEQLADLLARAARDVPVVLVRPPTYLSGLPIPGSRDAAADSACLGAVRTLVAGRPRTALVDWKRDRPENRDANLFFDHTHYRQPIARQVEAEIADALRDLR